MPLVTVKHTFILTRARGRNMLYVWADAEVADRESIHARDLGLKTVYDVEVHSMNPNINAGGTVVNPGSYDNYVIIFGSNVSGSAATPAGSFYALIKAIGI
ncbi:MAG: hypothetical protein DRJ47_10120 [Thermoprotei archaeon]|nr:MAG: hypothetical protein DRJ47_10120 [Thermoprotei archaeon]